MVNVNVQEHIKRCAVESTYCRSVFWLCLLRRWRAGFGLGLFISNFATASRCDTSYVFCYYSIYLFIYLFIIYLYFSYLSSLFTFFPWVTVASCHACRSENLGEPADRVDGEPRVFRGCPERRGAGQSESHLHSMPSLTAVGKTPESHSLTRVCPRNCLRHSPSPVPCWHQTTNWMALKPFHYTDFFLESKFHFPQCVDIRYFWFLFEVWGFWLNCYKL